MANQSAAELLELLVRLPGVLDMPLGEVLHRLTDGPRAAPRQADPQPTVEPDIAAATAAADTALREMRMRRARRG